MKKAFITFMAFIILISSFPPTPAYANYEPDDGLVLFLLEYAKQRNLAAQFKGTYDYLTENGFSATSAFQMAGNWLKGEYISALAAIDAIKTELRNMKPGDRAKLIDFYNQVEVKTNFNTNFNIPINLHNELNLDVFSNIVRNNTTYTPPAEPFPYADGFSPRTKEAIRNIYKTYLLDTLPMSGTHRAMFGDYIESSLLYDYINMYQLTPNSKWRGASAYQTTYVVIAHNRPNIPEWESRLNYGGNTEKYSIYHSMGIFRNEDAIIFTHEQVYWPNWEETDYYSYNDRNKTLLYTTDGGVNKLYESDPTINLIGRYYVLPEMSLTPSQIYNNNITNIYNTFNDISYVPYTPNNPFNDIDWLDILRKIIDGQSVPTINITINVEVPEPDIDFTEILEALKEIIVNQGKIITAIGNIPSGSHYTDNYYNEYHTHNYYNDNHYYAAEAGEDIALLALIINQQGQQIEDKLNDFIALFGESTEGVIDGFEGIGILLYLFFVLFLLFFVFWLCVCIWRFIWSHFIQVWL